MVCFHLSEPGCLSALTLELWRGFRGVGGREALYHCIQHKTHTLQNSPLFCLKKKIQYVNLQGRKWNLEVYLICIKRQGKKNQLRLMHFSLFRIHSTYICSMFCLCCKFGKLFKMQESGSDSLMLFQKKRFTAKDKQTLSVHPSVKRDRGRRKNSNSRSLSGPCLRL